MKLTGCLAVLLGFAAVPTARAQGYSIFGEAASSCGSYRDAYRSRDRDVEGLPYENYVSSVNGALTEANIIIMQTSKTASNIGEHTDVPGRMAWLDNWCAQNPLAGFSVATANLITTLITQKQ